MVPVADFQTITEARLACGMLQAHGIDAQLVSAEDGVVPSRMAGRFGGSSVHAPQQEADEARALLRDASLRHEAGATAEPHPGSVDPLARPAARRGQGWRLAVALVLLVAVVWLALEQSNLEILGL